MSSSLENTNNARIVAIGNPERQVCKPLHCGSKQQWTSHAIITLLLLDRATRSAIIIRAPPVCGELRIQNAPTERLQ